MTKSARRELMLTPNSQVKHASVTTEQDDGSFLSQKTSSIHERAYQRKSTRFKEFQDKWNTSKE